MIENSYSEIAKQSYFRRVLDHTPLVKENTENLIKLHQATTIFSLKDLHKVTNLVSDDWIASYIDDVGATPYLNYKTYKLNSNINVSHNEWKVEFSKDTKLKFKVLREILINSITLPYQQDNSAHKYFQNIIPLLLIFTDEAIENLGAGCYIFAPQKDELIQIKSWKNENKKTLMSAFATNQKIPSTSAMAYAIDIQKVASINGKRAYRDTLIDIGYIESKFENALLKVNYPISLGQVSQNEFSDNIVNHMCGTSVRFTPIVLLQWFGEIER